MRRNADGRTAAPYGAVLLIVLALPGCGADESAEIDGGWDFERMLEQPRYDVYEHSPLFADEKVMQQPPEGAVPRERVLGPPLLVHGAAGGEYAAEVPVPVTEELLALGRSRWEVFCAVCHGRLGYARTIVARNMTGPAPPSLQTPGRRAMSPGQLYGHIVEGPGRMPSYAEELSVRERWAVVAWLRRLQRTVDARPAAGRDAEEAPR